MPKVTFMPDALGVDVEPGTTLLEAGQQAGAKIGSACGGVCACSTCHVWVKRGLSSLSDLGDKEMDILDKAFDVKASSRLACQAEVGTTEVVIEITQESRKTYFDEHPEERRAGTPPTPSADRSSA